MRKSTRRASSLVLTIGAIGVVFGDIGTSPLYAMQAIFGSHGLHLAITQANVYGILSMIIWSITLVVSVKYLGFVMRAANKGEGGIMALVALIKHHGDSARGRRMGYKPLFLFIGIIGVALFYGDSAITPAISVLSAVEGLETVSADLSRIVLPVTLLLLAFLFWMQKYGTRLIGQLFGPIMLLWFCTIGIAGAWHVWHHPAVLAALSPLAAVRFIGLEPLAAFLALGAVVLAITGAEALYADMGHFGRRPIARGWFMVVFPALILCYMGQGAVMLTRPGSQHSPFMNMFEPDLRVTVVLLATAATLIASQSVISGAFSLTRQAIQLGYLPRLRVLHTSDQAAGQIYLPFVNFLLFVTVSALVIGFGSAARLANAYGIAVSGTLAIDTLLFLVVARTIWKRQRLYITALCLLFLVADLLFFAANLTKLGRGGWFPILLSAAALLIIMTWVRGQHIVRRERQLREGSLQGFIDKIPRLQPPIVRVPGYAVYIGHHADYAPLALHAAVEKLHELHQKVVIVTVHTATHAHVPESGRAVFDNLARDDGISHLQLTYGYHDTPNIPRSLQSVRGLDPELDFDPRQASYFISLSRVVPSRRRNMAAWRKVLYCFLSRNAQSNSDYYHLPIERTIELRALIEL